MKTLLLSTLFVLSSHLTSAQGIVIGDDGVVRCKGVPIGTIQSILGDDYEVVDRDLLIQRRDEGRDMTKMCVSNITNMSQIFATLPFNQAIGNWDVSSVTTMRGMFRSTPFNQPIGGWDVSKVVSMSQMFDNSAFNQPIATWDVRNVSDFGGMFERSKFNQPIGDWDVASATNMVSMFANSPFNQPIGGWDVVWVTDMTDLFRSSPFNQPIGDWDVFLVTRMNGMFSGSAFDQPINQWCVTKIKFEPASFSTGSPLRAGNKPKWGTCIGSPPKVAQIFPLDGSLDIERTTPFRWRSDTLSTSYQIQIIEGTAPIVIDAVLTDTVFTPTLPLKGNQRYNWRVRGINANRTRNGAPFIGEWSGTWDFITMVDTSIEPLERPLVFDLRQNYPNPFNPSTQIGFSIPLPTHVRLAVYTITGQMVSLIWDGSTPAGDHTATFDGTSVSSGVYIVKMTTPVHTQSRLISLIR